MKNLVLLAVIAAALSVGCTKKVETTTEVAPVETTEVTTETTTEEVTTEEAPATEEVTTETTTEEVAE